MRYAWYGHMDGRCDSMLHNTVLSSQLFSSSPIAGRHRWALSLETLEIYLLVSFPLEVIEGLEEEFVIDPPFNPQSSSSSLSLLSASFALSSSSRSTRTSSTSPRLILRPILSLSCSSYGLLLWVDVWSRSYPVVLWSISLLEVLDTGCFGSGTVGEGYLALPPRLRYELFFENAEAGCIPEPSKLEQQTISRFMRRLNVTESSSTTKTVRSEKVIAFRAITAIVVASMASIRTKIFKIKRVRKEVSECNVKGEVWERREGIKKGN